MNLATSSNCKKTKSLAENNPTDDYFRFNTLNAARIRQIQISAMSCHKKAKKASVPINDCEQKVQ